jgi:hypothetical protein
MALSRHPRHASDGVSRKSGPVMCAGDGVTNGNIRTSVAERSARIAPNMHVGVERPHLSAWTSPAHRR